MSFGYRLLYAVAFTPWEQMVNAPAAEQIEKAFEREEEGGQPPFGRALDLGCGSGIWSVKLAARGWDVTGVDLIPKALRRARRRADDDGVQVRWVQGNVTALSEGDVGSGHRLLLDFGCFHTIPPDRRDAYGASVSAVAAPGATFLLYGFTRPPRFAPMAASISTDEVERHVGAHGW